MKVQATKPEDLSLIPGTQAVEGRELTPTGVHTGMHRSTTYTLTHTLAHIRTDAYALMPTYAFAHPYRNTSVHTRTHIKQNVT